MLSGPALDDLAASIAQQCRSGLAPEALRAAVLPRLRRAVPSDALWWAAADPATLLFTQTYSEEIPAETGPYFVTNEFLDRDVNKWTELAQQRAGVGTLMHATDSTPANSARYRDVFAPLGLQDELRAVLRVHNSCWGYLCMHRATAQTAFSHDEVRFVRRIAPHLADGIRMGLLRQACEQSSAASGPGLILLAADDTLVGVNEAANWWLQELDSEGHRSGLPVEISVLATLLRRLDPSEPAMPRLRVRTRSGRWAVLHASWTKSPTQTMVTVIIEEAAAAEVAPVIMAAYGLTNREQTITALVCQGLSTRQITDRLHLTTDTVQDHLKSVFARTGVHSRGELVAAVLRRDYLPRAAAGTPISSGGAFAATAAGD